MVKIYYWITDKIQLIQKMIFLHQYKKHLKMRIEKNNFGRREEW
mgnify:FL=1|jgi:hypothetical protein